MKRSSQLMPVEPVFPAGQPGHPFMDVVVDGAELGRRVALSEVSAPTPQHGVEISRPPRRRSAPTRLGVVSARTLPLIEAMARGDGHLWSQ